MSPALFQRFLFAIVAFSLFVISGCGYHTSGHMVRLPSDVHTIFVPMFQNTTQTFRVEQTLTAAVVQELRSRTEFQVTTDGGDTADATLKGLVNYTANSPLTYDSVTGRIS